MLTRKKTLIIGGAFTAMIAAIMAGATAYFTLVPHDAPPKATLSSAVATLDGTAAATSSSTRSDADLTGTWTIASGSQSFVGYRVKEELGGIGTFTAVGRTSSVTGSLSYDGSAITNVQVTADLTGLTSDSSMRDGQLKQQGIQTDTYPTATFVLTQPIALDSAPAEGQTVSATAVGDLTLHGVTRSVSIPLEGQFTNGYAVVVGSLDISFADYGIQKPTSARVLGMEDGGVMELQLVFQQSTTG